MNTVSFIDFAYYRLIYGWMQKQIDALSEQLVHNTVQSISEAALVLVTLWVLLHGYRIATGQSREPAMVTVTHLLRLSLIVTAATVTSQGTPQLIQFMTDDVGSWINQVVTGNDQDTSSLTSAIDNNLAYTQIAMAAIDAVQVPPDDIVNAQALARAELIATLGTGGPAVVAGAMLLLYRITMALLIGLGPLFILCLIFKPTQDLFRRWLMYLFGTLFSMAVLYWVVSIAMQLCARVAAALWTTSLINSTLLGDTSESLSGQAMQQGGVGLILTVLIISTPPMAAMLFNGTLGNFMPFSAFGSGGQGRRSASQSAGHPAASASDQPAADGQHSRALMSRVSGRAHTVQSDEIKQPLLVSEEAMARAAYGDPRFWTAQVGAPAPGTVPAPTNEVVQNPDSVNTVRGAGTPSGAAWVQQFEGSKSTSDLVEPFRSSVESFISALEAAGAKVEIEATLRPPQRAYLMHYAASVARGDDPTTVPSMAGVDIDWVHRDAQGNVDLPASRAAAQEMVSRYRIVYPPALQSKHTEGRAIDMSVTGFAGRTFKDPSGHDFVASSQSDLESLGASYGVMKLKSDPPHWSDDGH